jgi:putative NIF3 family GTP cyclohydrolase 1 type 2
LTKYKDPIIFRALKSFTLANSQQNSLLRLAQEGISVYCPHTAVDAAPEGLNDWLADIVVGKATGPIPEYVLLFTSHHP